METVVTRVGFTEWLTKNCDGLPLEVAKTGQQTRAWFGVIEEREVFVKWYPPAQRETWAYVEAAIAGAGLHPAIVPLRKRVECADGTLLIYDRVAGENLGVSDARSRFLKLALAERIAAVSSVLDALASICEAGYMVVDWYFGNMLYDFDNGQIWLFDWELCRDGGSFLLEMDSNYGSSQLMAPEEFVRGSIIDEATLVFNAGRFALITLPDLAERIAPVLAHATYPARSGRYGSVIEFSDALRRSLEDE